MVNRHERRLPGGRRRNSVAFGAQLEHKEAAKTPAGNFNTYLAHQTQELFEHKYSALGSWIGANPRLSMLVGTLFLLSGLPGSFLLEGEASVLWIKFDTRMYENFAMQTNHFYMDYEHTVHLHHGLHHPPRPGLFQFTPKLSASNSVGRNGIMEKAFLGDVLDILNIVYNDTHVGAAGAPPLAASGVQGYDELCSRNGVGLCRSKGSELFAPHVAHQPSELQSLPPATAAPPLPSAYPLPNGSSANDYWYVLDGSALANMLTYPSHVVYYPPLDAVVPDTSRAELAGTFNLTGVWRGQIANTAPELSALPPSYWNGTLLSIPISTAYFHEGDPRKDAIVEWENAVLNRLSKGEYPHSDAIEVTFVLEASVQTEIASSVESAVPMVFVTVGTMIIYSITFLFTQVRCREGEMTCAYVVMQGALIPSLSGISALGWMYYLGFRVNLLCAFVLFLVLCVGVDCTFIFISAMKAVDPKVTDLKEAASMSLSEAGPAVTLTSMTSLSAFFLSAAFSTAMPGMLVFNLCMAIALLLNVIGFVFFFTGWQVINETRIAQNLSDFWLTNYQIGPHPPPECLQKKAGEGKLPSWVDLGNRLRWVLVAKYAPMLEKNLAWQLLGAFVMLGSLILSLAYIPTIGLGTPSTTYVADSSYLLPLFDDFKTHLGNTRLLTLDIVVEHLDIAASVRRQAFVSKVLQPMLERNDVLATNCFIEQYEYYTAAYRSAGLDGRILPWQSWLNETVVDLSSGTSLGPARLAQFGHVINPHLEPGEHSGELVPESIGCSVGIRQAADDAVERLEQARFFSDLQDVTGLGEFVNVHIVSHNYAEVISQDEELVLQILMTIVIALCAVACVLVLAIPIHRAIITAFNILLVVINMLGFMGYAGITYNPVSFCTLTMAIGFCVDYTVELMHFSSTAAAGSRMAEKMGSAVAACGYDVMHGCATAIVGCLVISFVPGEAFRMFGYLSMVMCAYGGMYALWCLPALMILVEQGINYCCCGRGGMCDKGETVDDIRPELRGMQATPHAQSPAMRASQNAMSKLQPATPASGQAKANMHAAIAACSASAGSAAKVTNGTPMSRQAPSTPGFAVRTSIALDL